MEKTEIRKIALQIKKENGEDEFVLTVKGKSMEPNLKDGNKIRMSIFKGEKIEKGQVVLYERQNNWVIHRILYTVSKNGKKYYLTKGDNNKFFDFCPIKEDKIIGILQDEKNGNNNNNFLVLFFLYLYIAIVIIFAK